MNDKFSKWFDEYGRKWLTSSMNLSEIARGLAHAAYVRGLRDGQELVDDPDRDAPVKPTMHPDLEWLAKVPKTFIQGAVNEMGPHVLLYKISDDGHGARVGSVKGYSYAPANVDALFTPAEIEQARKHLDNQKAKEDCHRHLNDHLSTVRDKLVQDLINLPDYETWFEAHGWETVNRDTRMAVVDSDVPATVHELYTHFRARLLDELRQAGVIGEDK